MQRGRQGRARRGVPRGVLRVRRQVVGRRPASQQHAAVGQLRGGGHLGGFSLCRWVNGDAGGTHLLLPVSAPDRLHPHGKGLNALLGALGALVVPGDGVLEEADLNGVASLVFGEPGRRGFGLFEGALVVGAGTLFRRSGSQEAQLAPEGGRGQRREGRGGVGAAVESVRAGEGGKGVAPARPPPAALSRWVLLLPPPLRGAGDVTHLLVRGVAE